MQQKIIVFIKLLLIACFTAGLFGILLNQVLYIISPEYAVRFKLNWIGFTNIHIQLELYRYGFAIACLLGFPFGMLLGLLGFVFRDAKTMFWQTLNSFLFAILSFIVTIPIVYIINLNYPRIENYSNHNGSYISQELLENKSNMLAYSIDESILPSVIVGFVVGFLAQCIAIWRYRNSRDRPTKMQLHFQGFFVNQTLKWLNPLVWSVLLFSLKVSLVMLNQTVLAGVNPLVVFPFSVVLFILVVYFLLKFIFAIPIRVRIVMLFLGFYTLLHYSGISWAWDITNFVWWISLESMIMLLVLTITTVSTIYEIVKNSRAK